MGEQPIDGLELLREGMRELDEIGIGLFGPHIRSMCADLYHRLGCAELASSFLSEGLSIADRTREMWPEAELYRQKGELQRGDPILAAESFGRALSVAREQGARLFELRASVSLARLWRDQGNPKQASELLTPIYGLFTEGFDTPDLMDARVLLKELEAPKP
jgi:predicted ATPase